MSETLTYKAIKTQSQAREAVILIIKIGKKIVILFWIYIEGRDENRESKKELDDSDLTVAHRGEVCRDGESVRTRDQS